MSIKIIKMKQYYYPLTLELEVFLEDGDTFNQYFSVRDRNALTQKIEELHSIYNLRGKNFNMYIVVKSNQFRIKRG